jgi:branched-chain amino acid transport system ATP-binding protein
MSELLVEATALQVYYGSSHVLRGVDFSVARGEAVGLMGRNGMGKTTLLKTLLGLLRARSGSIRALGEDVARAPAHRIARRGIGYVPEGRGIFANLTVRENLVMAARRGSDGRADWPLERVLASFPRLAERLSHSGASLSGGEQQMLSIGRALMTNPQLLILDEATEGLAPLIAREIWALVREVARSGIATVIVDKNFAAVNAITARNVILVKGEVAYQGPAAELRARPEIHLRHLGV